MGVVRPSPLWSGLALGLGLVLSSSRDCDSLELVGGSCVILTEI